MLVQFVSTVQITTVVRIARLFDLTMTGSRWTNLSSNFNQFPPIINALYFQCHMFLITLFE